jgi:hypothetical protein
VRTTLEGVVNWLFRVLGTLMAIGGLSLMTPAIPLLVIAAATPIALHAAALIVQCGLAFILAGVAVFYLARGRGAVLPNERHPPVPGGRPGLGGWLAVFGASLVILPAVLLFLLRPFFTEVMRAMELLTEAGVWEAAASQMGGLVLAPVLLALAPPALECLTALSFVIALLPLLVVRSERLPRIFIACLIAQAALVAASVLTSRSVREMRAPLENAIREVDATSPESVEALARIDQYVRTVEETAVTLAWTFVGYFVWAPGMLVSRRARMTFAPAPDVKAATKPAGNG